MKISLLAVLAVAGAVTPPSLAQDPGYSSRFEWQAQLPGSPQWTTGLIEIPETTPYVRVRAFIQTMGPLPNEQLWWNGTFLDGTVTGRSADAGDWVNEITNGDLLNSGPWPVSSRFGSVIKIDAPGDTNPPGVGDGWYRAREITPQLDRNRFATLTILEYTLHLDGSLGDREISHVFGYLPPATTPETPVYLLRSIPVSPFLEPVRPSVTVSNAIIRVVPGVGVMSVVLGGLALASRRRRR